MSVKTLVSLSLALLMAALPTLLTSCELHCLSPSVPQSAVNHCAGHGADQGPEPASPKPAGGRHDCSGHAVLAKATALPGVLPGLAPAATFPSLMPASRASGDGVPSPEPASSPPPSRSPTTLRL